MSLALKKDVDVIVNLAPRALPRNGFNIGMILGHTSVISKDERVKAFGSANEMLENGFALTDPLYLGAVEYFKQQDNLGASLSEIYIGAVCTETLYAYVYSTNKIYTKTTTLKADTKLYNADGTKYTGEDFTIASDGGTGYVVKYSTNTCTYTSADNVTLEDTYAEALQACRAKSSEWYGFTTCESISDADVEAISDAAEVMDATMYFANTSSPTALVDDANNIIKKINAKKYDRTIITYKENNYFSCGLMGYAMGANTGLINSAYSLKFKQISGQTASDLTTSVVNIIEKYYGNCYVKRADAQYEQGTCASGAWFDEMINLDKLVNDIQLNVYDLLYSVPKEPQTEAGHNDIAGVISQACEQARKIGFIGENLKWRRPTILALSKGDVLPNGYLIQWEDVNEQSDADRDARKSQPFYVCINLAGAIHSVVIQVNVSR